MKRSIWPIMKREFKTRFFSKGFWISTALFPLLTFGMTVLPSRMAMKTKVSSDPVRVIDTVGGFYPVLQDVVKSSPVRTEVPPLEMEPVKGRSVEEIKRTLNDLAKANTIQGYVVMDEAAVKSGQIIMYARNPSGALGSGDMASAFAEALRRFRLQKMGVTQPGVTDAIKGIDFDVEKATNDPKDRQSGVAAIYMSVALVMFIYFSLIFYGVYVLRGVLEEKSNRIVEVMVAAVKPFDLMMGKIIGIGAVGLTQIAIWVTFATLLSAPSLAGLLMLSPDNRPSVSPLMLACFPMYFVLGYFLFATIYAGIGSMFNSEEDAQQMVSTASMLLVVPILFLGPVMKNPSGTLATVLSLIPFFSPILMYLRIAVEAPPLWQIGLSVVIMLVTIFVMIWIVSKIYRVGILMYGKKPTIPEIVRWLRYT
jgi:ABC-2 type transport system permease protein